MFQLRHAATSQDQKVSPFQTEKGVNLESVVQMQNRSTVGVGIQIH